MRTLDEILDKIKELKGLKTDAALAEFFKVKTSTVATWRSRGTIPYDMIIAFCEQENIPVGWLLSGQLAAKYIEIDGQRILTVSSAPGLYKEDSEDKKEVLATGNDEFIFVPQFSDKISAGAGISPTNAVEIRIAFRKDWIRRKGDPARMSLIKVSGDSMEPTLLPGDLVLIDHARNYVDFQGGIYAISVDSQIMIKRLEATPEKNQLQIISDNSKYKPREASPDKVHINGKVIWFGRELER